MRFDPKIHHRRSIRLKGYDYTQAGAYFVTLCAWRRECLFGKVEGGEVSLTPEGQIVQDQWLGLAGQFPGVDFSCFVIMPNHMHGIIWINDRTGDRTASLGEASDLAAMGVDGTWRADATPLPTRPNGTQPGSLGAILQNFKSVSTRKINQLHSTPGVPVWQRNYYEHIIRDGLEMQRISDYIQQNPLRWLEDQLHPTAAINPFNRG